MPHQCVRCGTFYDDGANEILQGCSCGSKLFFFVKKSALEKKEKPVDLTVQDRKQIEKDVYEIIGDEVDTAKPVILDIESIRILKPGKYELDLVNLFKKDPLIYRLEEGKYVIDLPESFKKMKERGQN